MRKILVLVTAFALLAGGCGSDKKDAVNAGDETTTTAASGGGGDGDVAGKLLTASDLPAGFEEQEPSDDDEESSTSGCPELDALEDDSADDDENSAEAEFQRSDEKAASFQFLNEAVERYPSERAADDDFDKAASAFAKCKTFTSTEDDGTKITGTFTPVQFPKIGDDTLAVHMAATFANEGQTINIEGTVAAVRTGEHVALLMSLNFGGGALSTAQFEAIVRKAESKL
jgi:hypothetical protein